MKLPINSAFISEQEPLLKFYEKDRLTRKGKFFIVSGPSGVGKNSLLNYALKEVQGIYYLPSLTTRDPRAMESQGNPYYFISREEFESLIEKESFLEWKQIHSGDFYGTHLPTIHYALDNGFDITTDMDVLGCRDALGAFSANIVTIFIAPPNLQELQNRLNKRDGDPAEASRRLARVEMEMSYLPNYQHVVINDSIERAGEELAEIFSKYRNKNKT